MTITKRTINRKITEQEFIRLRKGDIEPFATYRQDAKACFSGDTEILMASGETKRLDSFVPPINKNYFTLNVDSALKVLTPSGKEEQVLYTFYGETKEWIEIDLESGDTIKVTPNHDCMVVRDNKRIKIKAENIVETDKFVQHTID